MADARLGGGGDQPGVARARAHRRHLARFRAPDCRAPALPVADWGAAISPRSGNPVYEKPVVLVIYRDDYKFLLDAVRPRQGAPRADYDLVIASLAYRARSTLDFRARRVIAPLVRALGPGGRLLGIQSHGDDPGPRAHPHDLGRTRIRSPSTVTPCCAP
ncbi:MAG: hypothetical protein WDN08_06385 [Rhizomicrobium sp.]